MPRSAPRARRSRRGTHTRCTTHRGRIQSAFGEPIRHRHRIEPRVSAAAGRHRNRELSARTMPFDLLVEPTEGRPTRRVERELRLDAIVPLAVREDALLRREAEVALFPHAVSKHTELLE